MAEITLKAHEATIDALLETFGMLSKAADQTESMKEEESYRKMQRKVLRELSRVEKAKMNSYVLPEQVKQAVIELESATKTLSGEREKMKKATEKLKKADEYLDKAIKVLEIAGKLFILV